jgi:pimeloyl-ACP methyl ester carboxylesterase
MRQILLLSLSFLAACQQASGPPSASSDAASLLHYEQTGTGEPLVLIQGANLPMEMWDPQFQFFASEFHVVRYDVRGFGGSARRDVVAYQSHTDLLALLDHLGIERANLVGLSLGGRIAIDFALTHPERVRSLVLAGPGLSGYQWDGQGMDAWVEPILKARAEGNFTRAAELWLESSFMAPAMQNAELAPRLTELARANSRVWKDRDLEIPLSPPAVDRLAEINAPALLLLGERDVEDEHRIVQLLARELRDARLHVVPGSGHVINLEKPDEFNRVVQEFLREHGRP